MTWCPYHDGGLDMTCQCDMHGPDLWPLVAAEVQRRNAGVVGLDLHALEAKWRAGALEHGDDWTQWTHVDFTRQIDAERMDLMLYRAMWQVAVNQRRGGSEAPGGPT